MKKILTIAVLLLVYSCSSTKFSKQVLVIPKSYKGEIWIFYEQSYNRAEFKKEGGKITFYVPKDGIIFSKYKPDDIIDLEEYNDNGKKIILDSIMKDDKVYPNGGGLGNLELPNKKMLKYSSYSVGNNNYQDSIMSKLNDYDYIVKKYQKSLNNKATD